MDTNELIRKLKSAMPSAVLSSQPLGHKGSMAVWIEMKSITQVASYFRQSSGGGFDWLENLSVMEIDGALVLSYFLRSTLSGLQVVLRGSLLPKDAETEVQSDSVLEIWPMAESFEAEAAEFFGIRFFSKGSSTKVKHVHRILPEGWLGYPLRKGYVFPSEFSDILHMRSVGHTEPDEHGVSQ